MSESPLTHKLPKYLGLPAPLNEGVKTRKRLEKNHGVLGQKDVFTFSLSGLRGRGKKMEERLIQQVLIEWHLPHNG